MFPLILASLFFVGVGVILSFAKRYIEAYRIQKVSAQFAMIANENGLQYQIPSKRKNIFSNNFPIVQGTLEGEEFELYMYIKKGNSERPRYYTAFRLLNSKIVTEDLTIYRENFFAKLNKLWGLEEVEIGKEDFDDFFILKSENKEEVKSLLNKPLREQLLNSHKDLEGRFCLKRGELKYEEEIIMHRDCIRERFHILMQVGKQILESAKKVEQKRTRVTTFKPYRELALT